MPGRPGIAGAIPRVRVQADLDGPSPAQPARRSIADLEATGLVLHLGGANARRIGTGGHRVFAGSPGTPVVKTFGRDALTWLRDHEAAAAGLDHHTACYLGTTARAWLRDTQRR